MANVVARRCGSTPEGENEIEAGTFNCMPASGRVTAYSSQSIEFAILLRTGLGRESLVHYHSAEYRVVDTDEKEDG
jgi:hypothetical protein